MVATLSFVSDESDNNKNKYRVCLWCLCAVKDAGRFDVRVSDTTFQARHPQVYPVSII